jgi:hypothetical protein
VLGKVIRANTRSFVFGTRAPKSGVPIFGALVQTTINHRNATVFGLVFNIEIKDSGMARMLSISPDVRPEEVEWLRDQVVPVEANVLTLAYREPSGAMRHGYPSQPPVTLDDVRDCAAADVLAFNSSPAYLRMVLAAKDAPADELLCAHLALAAELHPDPRQFVVDAGRELTRLLAADASRLEGLLQRICAPVN